MAEEWFTYSDLAERLGISSEAVRQKAIRARWPRRTANDGKAQVRVELEDVRAVTPQRRPKDPSDDRPTPDQTPVEQPSDTRTVDALTDHIATLRETVIKAEALAALERERADRESRRADDERARSDAERERANALTLKIETILAERAKAAEQNEQLEQQLDELKAVVEQMRRPWWRRFAR